MAERKRKFTVDDLLAMKKKMKSSTVRRSRKPVAKPELKYWQTQAAAAAVPGNGGVFCLQNGVVAGTDYDQRIGRKITSQYTQVKFSLYSSVLTVTPIICQVALVVDKQPVPGGTAAYGEIFDLNANGAVLATTPGFAFKNMQLNADRFDILWFEQIPVIGLQLLESFCQNKFRKLSGTIANVRFGAAGGLPETNQLLLCVGSSANTGIAASDATWRFQALYAYSDE